MMNNNFRKKIIAMSIILVLFSAGCSRKSIEQMEAQDFIPADPFVYGEVDISALFDLFGMEDFLDFAEDTLSSPEQETAKKIVLEVFERMNNVYFFAGKDLIDSQNPEEIVFFMDSDNFDFGQIEELLKETDDKCVWEEYKGFRYRISNFDAETGICFFYNKKCLVMSMNREMLQSSFDTALSGKNIRKNSSLNKQKKTMAPAEMFAVMTDLQFIKEMDGAEGLEMWNGLESAYFSMNVKDQEKALCSIIMENETQASTIRMFLGIAASPAALGAAAESMPPESGDALSELLTSIKVKQNKNAVEISCTVTKEMIGRMMDSFSYDQPAVE